MAGMQGLLAKGVPTLPFFIFILRCVVIAFALGILVASAYFLSLFGDFGVYVGGPPGFMIFIAIFTWGVVGVTMAVEHFAPHLYFRLAVIIAYGLNIIFLLSGWAWSASSAAALLSSYCVYGSCYGPGAVGTKLGGSLAACAALGALSWVMMIVILVFYVKACLADPEGDGTTSQANSAELGAVKNEATTTTTPVQPQQPYAPPPPEQYQQQQYQQQPAYGGQQYAPQQQAYPPQPPQQQQY